MSALDELIEKWVKHDHPQTLKLIDAERAKAQAELMEWENRQGSVCPEDFGFEEVITHLRSELERETKFACEMRTGREEWRNTAKTATARMMELSEQLAKAQKQVESARKTKVIVLCGSTRFTDEMMIKNWELTKMGNVVMGWNVMPNGYFNNMDGHGAEEEGIKEIVDEVHKRKIDLCDEIFVLNVGGYIGESTSSEINYAQSNGKKIVFMDEKAGSTWLAANPEEVKK
jgi:hypothetical protein